MSIDLGAAGPNPLAAILVLAATFSLLGASYLICYTIWIHAWEGWESWHARTGLDADRAREEISRRR